jgi:monofunctional biosynthetic peptidoglycan transglycosylase
MLNQAVPAIRKPAKRRAARRQWRPWFERFLYVVLATFALLLLSVLVFRFINPPITPVMLAEKLKGATLRRDWVPLERMSTSLPLAVIASEDGRFCLHWGVDWGAVKEAIQEGDGFADFRGASTITMQTVKNLYLWNGRSYLRKLVEAQLAYLITALWPKKRVMEVYLNIAQWGPGIFGAEAASRYYFRKSAAQLTRREAVLLAVALPNPLARNPARPSARMLVIARTIERRMPIVAGRSACVLPKR